MPLFAWASWKKGLRAGTGNPADRDRENPVHFTRAIRFAHVSFRYPERAEPVLEDFCCTVRKGEYVGIGERAGRENPPCSTCSWDSSRPTGAKYR